MPLSQALAKKSASVTADVVTHKYGEDAGRAAADGAEVLGDGIEAAVALRKAGPKSLAKRAAKTSMGKQLGGASGGGGGGGGGVGADGEEEGGREAEAMREAPAGV